MRADTTHLTNETSNDNLYLPNSQVSRQCIDILLKRERDKERDSHLQHLFTCHTAKKISAVAKSYKTKT